MTFDELVARINELAAKAKTEGLTGQEAQERAELRARFLEMYRQGLQQTLDNTYLVDSQGRKRKLERKKTSLSGVEKP